MILIHHLDQLLRAIPFQRKGGLELAVGFPLVFSAEIVLCIIDVIDQRVDGLQMRVGDFQVLHQRDPFRQCGERTKIGIEAAISTLIIQTLPRCSSPLELQMKHC